MIEDNTLLKDVPLSMRTITACANDGIDTIGELVKHSQATLQRVPLIGRKSLNEVIAFLAEHGRTLSERDTAAERDARRKDQVDDTVKAAAIAACREPGANLTTVAAKFGTTVNLLRVWFHRDEDRNQREQQDKRINALIEHLNREIGERYPGFADIANSFEFFAAAEIMSYKREFGAAKIIEFTRLLTEALERYPEPFNHNDFVMAIRRMEWSSRKAEAPRL